MVRTGMGSAVGAVANVAGGCTDASGTMLGMGGAVAPRSAAVGTRRQVGLCTAVGMRWMVGQGTAVSSSAAVAFGAAVGTGGTVN